MKNTNVNRHEQFGEREGGSRSSGRRPKPPPPPESPGWSTARKDRQPSNTPYTKSWPRPKKKRKRIADKSHNIRSGTMFEYFLVYGLTGSVLLLAWIVTGFEATMFFVVVGIITYLICMQEDIVA